MEKIIVPITHEDSIAVETLFTKCNTYLSMLGYLGAQCGMTEDNPIFNSKWNETAQLHMELETLKSQMDTKYHPSGDQWNNYIFDFHKDQMIYTSDAEF